MKNRSGEASLLRDPAHELRTELARKIALFIGSAENRATDIRGLTLHRRTAPTAPCSMTYQPSVTVIAQGRKRVELGRNIFLYDASRFLLTSVDLPVVSRVIEASEEVPCLALSLQLEMPVVRELLSRGRFTESYAVRREHAFEHCNVGRAEPPDGKGDRVDPGELCEAAAGGGSGGNRQHGRVHAAPSFPDADRHESSSVSEAASVAGGEGAYARGWSGRRQRGL
jgi:AraC-type transcriptional regulator N-terminus